MVSSHHTSRWSSPARTRLRPHSGAASAGRRSPCSRPTPPPVEGSLGPLALQPMHLRQGDTGVGGGWMDTRWERTEEWETTSSSLASLKLHQISPNYWSKTLCQHISNSPATQCKQHISQHPLSFLKQEDNKTRPITAKFEHFWQKELVKVKRNYSKTPPTAVALKLFMASSNISIMIVAYWLAL